MMTVGRAYERMGDPERAREIYRELVRGGLGGSAPLDRLVRTYLSEHRPAEARAELRRLAPRNPALASHLRLLTADTHAWEGNFEAALAGYAEAKGSQAPEVRATALESELSVRWLLDPADGASRINSLVWTLLDLGRAQRALNVIEGAEHLYVRNSDRLPPVDAHVLLYARGRALELLGADGPAAAAYAELLADWREEIRQLPLLSDAPDRLAALGAG